MLTQESPYGGYQSEIQKLRRENKLLKATVEGLKKQHQLLQMLSEHTRVGMFVKDMDNRYLFANSSFCQHLKISKAVLTPEKPFKAPRSLKKYLKDDKSVLRSGGVVFNLIEDKSPEGLTQWIETVKFPLLDNEGQISGVFGFTYDVTDQLNAQNHLQEAKTELKKAQLVNEALRQFSYAASHDLREPIRAVQGFIGLIKAEQGADLKTSTKSYLEQANSSLERMQQLIKDVLDYAVINGARYERELLPLDEALDEALLNLQHSLKEHQANVEREPLPQINGNKSLLVHYFQNLISNALKYRKAQEAPVIKIFAKTERQHYQIIVQDNGVGIDPAYAKEIFKPFKRLYRQSEISGSGIGLATSKRIIDIHQGKLWVESEVGEGARFIMKIPKY